MSARKTMDDLACERGVMAAAVIADHATEVEASKGMDGRLLFECLILGEELVWDPDRHDWEGPIVGVLAMMANGLLHDRDQLRAKVEHQERFCKEFIWGEDEPHEYDTMKAQLEAVTAQRDAWVNVYKAAREIADAHDFDEEETPSPEELEEQDRTVQVYDDAIDLAHNLDPRHRCPVCKGSGGSLHPVSLGFIPCPECDGNDWAECLAEAARELEETL